MRWLGVWMLLPGLVCCGSGDDDASDNGGGSGHAGTNVAGASGSSAGSQSSGGGGGRAGSGGTTSGAGTSGTGGVVARCEGEFGAPTSVLEEPAYRLGGLSLAPGELELIYAAEQILESGETGPTSYRRAVRSSTSVPFTSGSPVPELDAACAAPTDDRSGDLSLDGLRYYFVCYSTDDAGLAPLSLHLARRTSLDAPFVLDTKTYGDVAPGPSIGVDELELFVSRSLDLGDAQRYTRASVNDPFRVDMPLSGLEQIYTPELAADGLTLFGATTFDGTMPGTLWTARRPSVGAPFAARTVIHTASDQDDSVGSAAISADCRSLYFVDVARDATVSPVNELNRVLVKKR